MRPHKLAASAFTFLILFSQLGVTAGLIGRRRRGLTTPTTQMASDNDAAVLRELKETIRKQASEIDSLKKQLSAGKSKSGGGGGGGGHGAPVNKSPDELAAYLHLPFYRVASMRVGWLGLFLVSLSMTALIMNGFEDTLEKQLELAYFVPLLAGHGGNTGGQAVGTVLSAMSAGVVSLKDAPRVIPKEAMSGELPTS